MRWGMEAPRPTDDREEREQWKYEPPYRIQPPDDFGPVHWRGSCECGKATYQLNRQMPLDAKFCHCRGCQVLHGKFTSAMGLDHLQVDSFFDPMVFSIRV